MQIFKKKKPEQEAIPAKPPKPPAGSKPAPASPTERIKSLYSQGLSEAEIIKTLRKDGIKAKEAEKTMDQALKEIAAGESRKIKTQGNVSVQISSKPPPAPKAAPKVTVSVFDSGKPASPNKAGKPKAVPKPEHGEKAGEDRRRQAPSSRNPPSGKESEDVRKSISDLRKEMEEVKRLSEKESASENPVVNISILNQDKAAPKPQAKPPKPLPEKSSKKEIPMPIAKAPKPESKLAPAPQPQKVVIKIEVPDKSGEAQGKPVQKKEAPKALKPKAIPKKDERPDIKKPIAEMKKDIREIKKLVQKREKAAKKPAERMPKPPVKPLAKPKDSPSAKPPAKPSPKVKAIQPKAVSTKLMVTKADVKRIESGIKDIRKALPAKAVPKPKPVPKAKPSLPKPAPKKGKAKKPGKKIPRAEQDIRNLKESVRYLDRSVTKLSKDLMRMEEKIPSKAEPEEIKGLTENELRTVRQMLAKSSFSDNQNAGLQIKLDKIENAIDAFSDRFDSLQRDFTQIKIDKASHKPGQEPNLKEKIEKMEKSVENISQHLMDRQAPDARRIKIIATKLDEFEERISKIEAPAPVPGDAGGMKPLADRLDSLDSRITGMNDKIVQLSGDAQKLSSYFMDGIRHLEERIRGLERSRMLPEPSPRPIRAAPMPMMEAPKPVREPPAARPRPLPEPEQEPGPAPMPKLPAAPVREVPSTLFTKLREGTIEKRPMLRVSPESDDMDILKEHIAESMNRGEDRQKIARDLFNAGYEQEAIEKAFMHARIS
jgi:hypothetical protein